jgi:hypothetical protein
MFNGIEAMQCPLFYLLVLLEKGLDDEVTRMRYYRVYVPHNNLTSAATGVVEKKRRISTSLWALSSLAREREARVLLDVL